MDRSEILKLEDGSKEIRKTIIGVSEHCKTKIHWGSSLSCVEILNALYAHLIAAGDKKDIKSVNERVIVSKGHAALALYSVMKHHKLIGEFEHLYQKDGSAFPEEITMEPKLGIPCSTGSLGLGLPYAAGLALRSCRKGCPVNYYVLMGDGECNEGSVWETVMFAAHNKLSNLILIIDRNGLQADGSTENIISLNCLEDVFDGYGWNVTSVDGHSYEQLLTAFSSLSVHRPTVIIADTVKGKGISFMENEFSWHDRVLTREQLEIAKREVGLSDA